MTGKKRIAAVLLAALIVLLLVFSSLFIVLEAGHDCTGEDFPVCAQMMICEIALKTLSCAACAVFAVKLVLRMAADRVKAECVSAETATPVSRGERLLI